MYLIGYVPVCWFIRASLCYMETFWAVNKEYIRRTAH